MWLLYKIVVSLSMYLLISLWLLIYLYAFSFFATVFSSVYLKFMFQYYFELPSKNLLTIVIFIFGLMFCSLHFIIKNNVVMYQPLIEIYGSPLISSKLFHLSTQLFVNPRIHYTVQYLKVNCKHHFIFQNYFSLHIISYNSICSRLLI